MLHAVIAMMAAAIASSPDAAPGADAPSASPPPVTSAPATPPAKVKKVKDPGDKLVCISDPMTGSHLGGDPICKKQKEWDAITNASKQMLNDTIHMQQGYKIPGG